MRLLCFLILFPLIASAQLATTPGGGVMWYKAPTASGGGSCNTTNVQFESSFASHVGNQDNLWYGCSFVTTNGFSACGINVVMYRSAGTVTATLTIAIYTDSSGHPGTQVGSATGSLTCSTLPTGASSYVSMPSGLSATLSSSTAYWIVFHYSNLDTAGNTAEIAINTLGGANILASSNGTSWSAWVPGYSAFFHLLGQ